MTCGVICPELVGAAALDASETELSAGHGTLVKFQRPNDQFRIYLVRLVWVSGMELELSSDDLGVVEVYRIPLIRYKASFVGSSRSSYSFSMFTPQLDPEEVSVTESTSTSLWWLWSWWYSH